MTGETADEDFLLALLNTTPVVDGQPTDELGGPAPGRAWLAGRGGGGSEAGGPLGGGSRAGSAGCPRWTVPGRAGNGSPGRCRWRPAVNWPCGPSWPGTTWGGTTRDGC